MAEGVVPTHGALEWEAVEEEEPEEGGLAVPWFEREVTVVVVLGAPGLPQVASRGAWWPVEVGEHPA